MPEVDVESIVKQAEQFYDRHIAGRIEKQHAGKYVAIDCELKRHYIADSADEASAKARINNPGMIFVCYKIGEPKHAIFL